MLKKLICCAILYCAALSVMAEGKAKYIFYFIGDGMGVNQVNGAETYLAALEGRIGVKALCFTGFPYSAFSTTYSATNGVTDSAAAGTALATGHKTKNGALGVLSDLKTPVNSIAVWAKQAGAAVGVSTSVSIDHATPAAFYAHQGTRSSYHAIGMDMIQAGFDFYAGSDFMEPTDLQHTEIPSLYDQCAQAGYTIVRGYKEFTKKAKRADKLVLFQSDEASRNDRSAIPYAIDRKNTDLTLQQITRAGIQFLTKKTADGFFLMVEGGKIDWACHGNDAATVFKELTDMDDAVRVAYEFYEQHPDETLIVVTADHETGGIVLGRGAYELRTDLLRFQRMSAEAYGKHIKQMHARLGDKLTWEIVEADLEQQWGFGAGVELNHEQHERLYKAYNTMMSGSNADKETLYAKTAVLADVAREVMAECALIGWQSTNHSNGYTPVYAVGAGAEEFHGKIDNTQIPLIIARAAQWEQQ